MAINLGVGLSWRDGGYDEFVALVQKFEALGYTHLWASNEKFFRDMYVKATVTAEHTTDPKIGTFVADPYTHHPALTAMAIATPDEVSKGHQAHSRSLPMDQLSWIWFSASRGSKCA